MRQSCHLAVAHGGRGLIVVQEDSPTNRGFRVRLGAELALDSTCSGRIILANLDDEERAHQLELAKHFEAGEEVEPAELEEALEQIRSKGFYQVKSKYTQGVTDVGFPIFG